MERLLAPLRDDPLPPSSVDIGLAIVHGRRHVRRRRITGMLAAGLSVIALVGTVITVRGHGDELSLTPAQPLPSEAPSAFDPMARYATFGWLPRGQTVTSTSTALDQLLVRSSAGAVHDPDGIELRLVTAGHDIALAASEDFVTEPGSTAGWTEVTGADPVNGRSALWNAKAAPGGAALRWEYASNAWAEVIVHGAQGDGGRGEADARVTARLVAERIRYGVNEPMRLPFGIEGLPTSFRPMQVTITTPTGAEGRWSVQVGYGAGRRSPFGDWPITVTLSPRRPGDQPGNGDGGGTPNGTLGQLPVRRSHTADGGESLQVYDVQGLQLELGTHDEVTTDRFPGGVDGIFRVMTFHPDPEDWQ
jgi:hypothetical protein